MAYGIGATSLITLQMKIKVYKGDITSHGQKQIKGGLGTQPAQGAQALGVSLNTTLVPEEMPAWQGEQGCYLQAQKWNESYGLSCLDCNPKKFRIVLGTFTNIWSSPFL